jgi:hypothetical protein
LEKGITNSLDHPLSFNHTPDYQWFVYEGDLTITPEQVELLSGYSFLITGNLTVKGVLNYQDISSLFVLGNIKAKSILLSSSTCYFAGTTYFDEALIIMGGSGAVVQVNNAKGLFVYSDSDAAKINVSEKNVICFADYSYDESFGDVTQLLDSTFLECEDDGDTYIDIDCLCEAILENESFTRD